MQDITLRVNPKTAYIASLMKKEVSKYLRIPESEIRDIRVIRRSIDARKRNVMVNLNVRVAIGKDEKILPMKSPIRYSHVPDGAPVLIIVGAGPAGLFAALRAIERGIRPIVLERGKDVDRRRLDIAAINREKHINPDSNYCFGEGGAGAFSDGKLYTRSKKRGSVDEVLQIFVQHGASENILIDAHPHIGSDRLPHVIREMRNTIKNCGGEVRFDTKVDGLLINSGRAVGVRLGDEKIEGDGVILATGHSAHDTFKRLHADGMPMSAKGIAVGVRLEHPQHLIDCIQYHSPDGRGKYLPAAEYSFVTQAEGRGVYSFCMCPGGVVVPAGSSEGELVVNGMSASARSGAKANSGMVVEVRPGDFPEYDKFGELSMLHFQEDLEIKMYQAAGNSIVAPAQRMDDFVHNRLSTSLPDTTYAPGVQSADFNKILPTEISRRLRLGFIEFGKKSRGFLTNEAVMIGLESRTSSPIRMDRDSESLECINIENLYPAGEGAGYAGGIVSAAIDGIRCADAFAAKVTSENEQI